MRESDDAGRAGRECPCSGVRQSNRIGGTARTALAGKRLCSASEPILAELRRTYRDSCYARRLSPDLDDAAISLLIAEAIMVEVTASVSGVATHPEDDLVLATAASARAEFPGTRDRQLLKLGSFLGTRIVHPADLVGILE